MRIFLDTNVLLSAFFGRGLCDELFCRLLESQHEVLIGEPVAREFVRIARDKFGVAPSDLSIALEVLQRLVRVPAATPQWPGIRDPDDAPIIACAVAAKADLFVTGDKALLELGRIEDLIVLSPRECWERVSAK